MHEVRSHHQHTCGPQLSASDVNHCSAARHFSSTIKARRKVRRSEWGYVMDGSTGEFFAVLDGPDIPNATELSIEVTDDPK